MLTQKKKFKLPQISSVCINGIMVFVLLVVLVPMLNLVAKSFSDPAKVAGMPGWQIIPAGFSLINYEIIFSNPAIWRALLNSVFITVVGVALNVVVTSMAAYAMTRPVLPGKKKAGSPVIWISSFSQEACRRNFIWTKRSGMIKDGK